MTTLASSINIEEASHFAAIQGRCYMANDFDPMKVWDGAATTASDAGMAYPATVIGAPSTGAGNVTAGDHLVRYRYYDSRSLYVSNPSPSLLVTSTGQSLTWTVGTNMVASADAKCDQIILEATAVNGTKYYRVGFAANTASATVVYNITDEVLIQGDNVSALTGDFGHEQPPLFSIVTSHRGRLFGAGSTTRTRTVGATSGDKTITGTDFSAKWAGRLLKTSDGVFEIASVTSATELELAVNYSGATGDKTASIYSKTPNRLFWSTTLYPEGWKPSAYARDVLNNKSDELRGIVSYQNELFIFGRHSAERLVFTADPGTQEGQIVPIAGERGVHNQRCLIEAEGILYAWDRLGMYMVGSRPEHISKPIDRTLTQYVDYDQSADFHGVFDPTDRVLIWFFTVIDDTLPKMAAAYDLDGGRWTLYTFAQGITASHVVPDSDGQVRAMLGDENGYTWFYGIEGGWDGLPPTAPPVTAATGTPTQTAVSVANTLPTSPSCAGVVAYNATKDEYAVIASNTATALTLTAPGFTTAPAAGDVIYLGKISWEYETKWFTMGSDARVVYLKITLHPSTATGKCRVYAYKNWSDTPETLTKGANDSLPDGVRLGNGSVTTSTYMEIDLDGGDGDGVIMVPFPADYAKHWKAKLVCDRPDGEIRLLDVSFQYKEGKSKAEH